MNAARSIAKTGFRTTPAQYGELGEGIYGTCVKPGTSRDDAKDAINEQINKAKRFAHDAGLRGKVDNKDNIPVLMICIILFSRVDVRPSKAECVQRGVAWDGGSDPEGCGDKATDAVWLKSFPRRELKVGPASQWKMNECQACYTDSTDGVRFPYIASKNAELCFRPNMDIAQMRIIRLDKEGTCPFGGYCGYGKAGRKCPFFQHMP